MGKSSKKREYSSESAEDDEKSSKKHNKHKSKKSKHKKKKKKRHSSSSESSFIEEEWVVKNVEEKKSVEVPSKREDWMSADNFCLPTFTNEKSDKRKTVPEKEKYEAYDPATNSRELNPYFRTGEGGLPTFKRPKDDDHMDYRKNVSSSQSSSRQSWRKKDQQDGVVNRRSPSRSPEKEVAEKPKEPDNFLLHTDFLTDEQMNSMAAKMLRAEMMGKTKQAAELKEKLEKAKEYRKINPKTSNKPQKMDQDNKVVLSLPTASGMNRPIKESESQRRDPRDKRHNKKKRVETHEGGERTRYYPDDGKYDIKTMFEREKYSDGKDQDIEFAKAISKVKESQQMDMADIFSDNIRKDKEAKSDERDEAIREAKKLERILESCFKCFDSPKMNKDLIVHVGKYIYVAIPYHERLVPHHLVLSPIQHVPCTTMIDEEVWDELKTVKKALTRFFFDRKEDVVFFETVKHLHRRPHMEVQMMSSKDFEMIQFYFKKAIQESEKFTVNKKLIDIKGDKNIRSSIPRGLPYFWIDFGTSGMAHMIEDQEEFPSNFAQEIIGGMINVDVNRFRKPRKEYDPQKVVKYFSSLLKHVIENL